MPDPTAPPKRQIWKFELNLRLDSQQIDIPACSRLHHFDYDARGKACVWALIDPAQPLVKRTVYIVGTGQDIPNQAAAYVGSITEGMHIWHLFA